MPSWGWVGLEAAIFLSLFLNRFGPFGHECEWMLLPDGEIAAPLRVPVPHGPEHFDVDAIFVGQFLSSRDAMIHGVEQSRPGFSLGILTPPNKREGPEGTPGITVDVFARSPIFRLFDPREDPKITQFTFQEIFQEVRRIH